MVASTAMGIVFLFFTIFQCLPVAYFWNQPTTEGHCLDIGLLLGIVYMYSGVTAACDFTLASLPVYIIWRLQMNRRTKIVVSALLGLACVFVCPCLLSCFFFFFLEGALLMAGRASLAVIIRIPFLHHADRPDFLCGLISSSKSVVRLICSQTKQHRFQCGRT